MLVADRDRAACIRFTRRIEGRSLGIRSGPANQMASGGRSCVLVSRNREGILSGETVATALARACSKLLKADVARRFESRVGHTDD